MKRASELIPWKVTDVSIRPYKQMWSFNPSLHFDGATWRCVIRCSDYAMPEGVTIRSPRATPGQAQTKNAMVVLDPNRWRPVEIYKMRERDGEPRGSCESLGFEDIRLFRTDRGGLQGIGASLHLARTDNKRPLAEQVLLSFDDQYDIVDARPIRGAWSESPQKNWVPFDHCAEPRFLYAIDRGTLFDDRGSLCGAEAVVRPPLRGRSVRHEPDRRAWERARDRAEDERGRATEDRRTQRGRRQRDEDLPRGGVAAGAIDAHVGLRGGTQLVRVGDDKWLGLGHAMRFVDEKKFYWHVLYLVDAWGKMTAASEPIKLAENGIEFAAGLAVDDDRVVVSFGVDDMECKIGETRLSAVLSALRPVGQVTR